MQNVISVPEHELSMRIHNKYYVQEMSSASMGFDTFTARVLTSGGSTFYQGAGHIS